MALEKITKVSGGGVTEPLVLGSDLEARNGNFSGILTATSFSGSIAGSASTAGYATTSFGLEGTPDIVVGSVTSGDLEAQNGNFSGIVTASTFSGNVTGNLTGDVTGDVAGNLTGDVTGNLTGDVTGNVSGTAGGLSGTPDITVGAITGSSASFSGNVDIGGVLTYEDVTNVDAIGLVTARSGVNITGGDLAVSNNAVISGILTVGSSSITINGDGNEVKVGTGLTLSHTNGVYVGQVNLHSTGLELGTGNVQSHNIYSTGVITAISFSGDGSGLTGISAGYWEQTSAGINTSSSVGIGTTTPATDTLLHLNKIGGTESLIRFTNSTTGTGVGDGAIVGINVDENLVVAHFETKDIILSTDNTIRLKVKSDGKVGIGTNYDPSYKLDVEGDVNFTGNLYQDGALFDAGGTALTVTEVATPGGNVNVSVGDVSKIQFNNGSGFNVTDEGSGSVLIDLGSNFNPWYVDGQQTLKASGEEPIEIVAGPGIAITTKAVASVGIGTTFSKAITFSADGNSINGIGTAVPNTNTEFYYSGPLRIDTTTIVDVPDDAESNVAYTRHTDIVVETGAELIIADGDEIIPDVLDIVSPSIVRPLGQSGSTSTTTLTVQNSGSVVGTSITAINFNTDLSVTVDGGTATVNSTASGGGGGGGVSEALAIAYAIAL
jgi:hypothetical protein